MYTGYSLLEKLDILGQGLAYCRDLFLHWGDIMCNPHDEQDKKCFFYYLNGEYFYNAIALEDNSYYLWKTSYWARKELPLHQQELSNED